MEKKRREWVDNGVMHWEPVYSAAEVDAYRAAVKALVRVAEKAKVYLPLSSKIRDRFSKAIAAVERLEVNGGK